jgi:glycosyltransferase involved in cell wall biosynthesis
VTSVLFACEYYPPFAPGGAEWTTAAWAAALARRGHSITVVTPNYGAPAREQQEGVSVVRVPFPARLSPGQGEVSGILHRNSLFYRYFGRQLRRAAQAARASLIHAQGKAALPAAVLAGRALGTPVVATIRDLGLVCPLGACPLFENWSVLDCSARQFLDRCVPFHLDHYHDRAGMFRRALVRGSSRRAWRDLGHRQAALRRAQMIVGVSRGILDVYPERLVPPAKSRVVHSLPPRVTWPSDEEVPAARRSLGVGDAPLVLYAGKISLGKGTPMFLESLGSVRVAVPGVRFVIAGKGELRAPAAPDVHVLGSIPQPELFALYRAADVVVVPSIWPEPLSRVLLEAMQLGRPVVATAVGGTPEVVEHGVTGLLVPRRDPEALAKAMTELLLDPARRAAMGQAAVKRAVSVFSEDRLVGQLLAAYDSVLGASP